MRAGHARGGGRPGGDGRSGGAAGRAAAPSRAATSHLPARLVRFGLDASYGTLLVALAPWALARVCLDAKARARWLAYLKDLRARFGHRARRETDRPCVWVHGVSVGEVKAAARLVESIEAQVPGVEVVITVTTDTGYRVARERYPGRRVEFYPPDLSWIVRDTLDRLRPDLVVLVESEFWPNFLGAVAERRIPVALVNGRISARSAARFRAAGPLSRPLMEALSSVCVQLPVYAERFRSLGIPAGRIAVTGNLKLDNVPLLADRGRAEGFARLLGVEGRVAGGRALLVAGSTHRTEERVVGRLVQRMREEGRALDAIVVPRHPGRADAAEGDLRRAGLEVVRRSRLVPGRPPPAGAVVLLDTVGELEIVYSLADVVFVGGSLLRHGGQNMMEPASLGKPVVVGPHTYNFRGEVDLLVAAGGIAVASDAAQLEMLVRKWLDDPAEAAAVGGRGRAAILASKGATGRTLDVLLPLLAPLATKAHPPAPA